MPPRRDRPCTSERSGRTDPRQPTNLVGPDRSPRPSRVLLPRHDFAGARVDLQLESLAGFFESLRLVAAIVELEPADLDVALLGQLLLDVALRKRWPAILAGFLGKCRAPQEDGKSCGQDHGAMHETTHVVLERRECRRKSLRRPYGRRT